MDGSPQANQGNIGKIEKTEGAIGAIAVFNDVIRDGLKGSVFQTTSKGYISGEAKATASRVRFGISGGNLSGFGWKVPDNMVINYMSAHDNNTLWDKLLLSAPNATVDERNQMNNLGAAILMISKGTPFWQAGEEMLRSKPNGDGTYNHNSYNSSDAVNNIDWSVLDGESREYKTMLYYKGLIQLRKEFGIFSSNDTKIEAKMLGSGVVILTYDDGNGGIAKVVINPHKQTLPVNLEGTWNLVANSEQAGTSVISVDTGEISAESISIRVYVNDVLLNNR
jgi:pullulanase